MSAVKQREYICSTCSGTNVYQDAWVGMNDEMDIRTFDNFFCDDCQSETTVKEVEVKE